MESELAKLEYNLGGVRDMKRLPQAALIIDLKTEAIAVREAERLHPPAPGGFRGVIESFDYEGYRIPAGWTVMYSIVWTHQAAELWRDPGHFDPDRFAPARAARTSSASSPAAGSGRTTSIAPAPTRTAGPSWGPCGTR